MPEVIFWSVEFKTRTAEGSKNCDTYAFLKSSVTVNDACDTPVPDTNGWEEVVDGRGIGIWDGFEVDVSGAAVINGEEEGTTDCGIEEGIEVGVIVVVVIGSGWREISAGFIEGEPVGNFEFTVGMILVEIIGVPVVFTEGNKVEDNLIDDVGRIDEMDVGALDRNLVGPKEGSEEEGPSVGNVVGPFENEIKVGLFEG